MLAIASVVCYRIKSEKKIVLKSTIHFFVIFNLTSLIKTFYLLLS